jgi:hypothetical protein
MIRFNCKRKIFNINGEVVRMEVFRESFIDGSNTILQSPPRQVFGIHPTNGKILVPIDLCILVLGNPTPKFDFNVNGRDVLDAPTSALVGTVENFSVPPAGNINPIVTLDPDIPIDRRIKKIITPSTVKAGDVVTLDGDSSFTGNVLAPVSDGLIIGTFPFPLNPSLTILAFRVAFSKTLRSEDIGSPIVMADKKILGMLLTAGNAGQTVFVYPSSSI